jgi:PIN domain nuclease of toxin-antitoxin system
VRLLLDSHVLLWWLGGDPSLARTAQDAIADPENAVAVSAASAWEIEIKRMSGKLEAPEDLGDRLAEERFSALPITAAHAIAAARLPAHHRDPFDRMLIAQAQLEGLTILTRDPRFEPYAVATLPA